MLRLFSLILLVLICLGGQLFSPLKLTKNTSFVVSPGSSLQQISNELVALEVLEYAYFFKGIIWLTGQQGKLKAGTYSLAPPLSLYQLGKKLLEGKVVQQPLTIYPGDTKALHPTAKATEFLGRPVSSIEGLLLADTYYYTNSKELAASYSKSIKAMEQLVTTLWEQRQAGLPYENPYEALIMASIIEKEAFTAADKPMIARVFINRLQGKMRLQSDVTVAYGIWPRSLTRAAFKQHTPYNTYMVAGLPPTPICMPSIDSLQAALQPAATTALFFVLGPWQSSVFSQTFAEHQQAVVRYQKMRSYRQKLQQSLRTLARVNTINYKGG